MTVLVIGVGSPDGGDDAVGLVVAQHVLMSGSGLRVLTTTAPTELLDLWEENDEVVLVDCVRTGDPTGTVTLQRLDGTPAGRHPAGRGTHGFGVTDAVELARVLDRLPRRLVLVGIEGGAFTPAAPLSPAVAAAVQEAVAAVLNASLDLSRQ